MGAHRQEDVSQHARGPVDFDSDGDVLVSARNICTIYEINRYTGKFM